MEHDAFEAGVAVGGLISTNQIKLLICWILKSVDRPIGRQTLLDAIQYEELANYFDTSQSIDDLIERKNVIVVKKNDEDILTLSEAGREIATELAFTLPIFAREKAVRAALNMLTKVKLKQENEAIITPLDNGYNVCCNVLDGDKKLLSVTMYVTDRTQAELIKKTFLDDPLKLYSGSIALLTGDYNAVKAQFEE